MPGCKNEGRGHPPRVQPSVPLCGAAIQAPLWLLPALCLALCGCSDALSGPIDLFHNLEGGAIAAERPPPPGVDQPYPKLGTVPPKPVVADAGYRQSLQAQLATERDRTQRTASDTPIALVPPPPGPSPPVSASAAPPTANATLETAEAPPASTPVQPIPVQPPAVLAQPAASAAALADSGPPPGTPMTLAGAPTDMAGLPPIPDAPPAPASFEGVPAEPAPTPHLVTIRQPPPAGTRVFFGAASTVLSQSQAQAVRDFAKGAGGRSIEIIGLGEAGDDSPEGQATAIALGLSRARAVADALAAQHVLPESVRIGANAFGRGAVLRLL